MLIDNREYSEPELKSYIKGLQKRIADAENLNNELKKEKAELKSEFEKFKNMVIPCVDISKKNHKINELTKYLRLAMHDFERVTKMCTGMQCDSCPHEYMGNYELANGCIWQYKEQVLNLIGGDANGSDE